MRLGLCVFFGACGTVDKVPCRDGYEADHAGHCVLIDEAGEPSPEDSGQTVIDNQSPSAPGLAIFPDFPRAQASDLSCKVIAPSVDLDGDDVTYTYRWQSNDGDSVVGETVERSRLFEGQTWTCLVTPFDGVESGPDGDSSVVIGAPPAPWSGSEVSLSTSDYLFTGEAGNDGAGG